MSYFEHTIKRLPFHSGPCGVKRELNSFRTDGDTRTFSGQCRLRSDCRERAV